MDNYAYCAVRKIDPITMNYFDLILLISKKQDVFIDFCM